MGGDAKTSKETFKNQIELSQTLDLSEVTCETSAIVLFVPYQKEAGRDTDEKIK